MSTHRKTPNLCGVYRFTVCITRASLCHLVSSWTITSSWLRAMLWQAGTDRHREEKRRLVPEMRKVKFLQASILRSLTSLQRATRRQMNATAWCRGSWKEGRPWRLSFVCASITFHRSMRAWRLNSRISLRHRSRPRLSSTRRIAKS